MQHLRGARPCPRRQRLHARTRPRNRPRRNSSKKLVQAPTLAASPETLPPVLGFTPASRVGGSWRPAGSKSLAQRALLCGALAAGTTRVAGFRGAEDTERALAFVQACGVGTRRVAPGAVELVGRAPGPHGGLAPTAPVELGESGTLARLALAALALCGRPGTPCELVPAGTLARRGSPALFAALERAGLSFERAPDAPAGGFAVRFTPLGPPSTLELERPGSSQEVTGLLLALAAFPGEFELRVTGVVPSRPYLSMTLGVLRRFGVRVEERPADGGEVFFLRGPLTAQAEPFLVEPDASGAAVFLAAACLSGGDARVEGLGRDALQGDVRVVEHLAAFGCAARAADDHLEAAGFPSRGAVVDLVGEPDLAPVLAAVAAGAALRHGATSELRGLATLHGKESSRVEVLAEGLTALGLAVEWGEDRMRIGPGGGPARADAAAALDPRSDHRMAFAFALLGLLADGVRVTEPGCVAKSWPGFWEDLRARGAVLSAD